MLAAPIPADETERLAELRQLGLLDTPAEERFDRLARLASQAIGVPMAYISLVDDDRQWFKAQTGMTVCETARDISFCGHAINQDEPLIIADARKDRRFADNPLVVGEPHIRFYAGHPLKGPGGHNVGTLCVADRQPRELTENEREVLTELADLAQRELTLLETVQLQDKLLSAQRQLLESQSKLNRELDEAAHYIQSLLPPRLDDEVTTDWAYVSSSRLGGDMFGYHWLDSQRLAIYLFDVCGHGVGASLLSVSIHDVLRRQTHTGIDFDRPCHVLAELNAAFPMERYGDRFFTMWYGVFDVAARTLRYSNGGHPPAVLCAPGEAPQQLHEASMMIGVVPDATFGETTARIEHGTRLYLLSDGVFEASNSEGKLWGMERFIDLLAQASDCSESRPNWVREQIQAWQGTNHFSDDFSLLEVTFR